jgi:hypothetical protein
MMILEMSVQSTVAKISETVKEVGADGIITKEEGQMLKTAAMQAVNNQLPPATKKILEIANKELQDFISGKIEVAVLTTKRLKAEAGDNTPA